MPLKIVYFGDKLETNGIVRPQFFQRQQLRGAFTPPSVMWQGKLASLYFWNYTHKDMPFNHLASQLIMHDGFLIRGPAIAITGWARWHYFKRAGDEEHVREALAPVLHGLIGKVFIAPFNGLNTHQNIYIQNEDDAFAVKMALP
jgi:hypothetical protein